MPVSTDPAPCGEDEKLYECQDCLTRLCSADRVMSCPQCGGEMENLSKPRVE